MAKRFTLAVLLLLAALVTASAATITPAPLTVLKRVPVPSYASGTVDLVINTGTGLVMEVKPVGETKLDAATIAALKSWTFRVEGSPWPNQPVRFTLTMNNIGKNKKK